MPNVRIIWSILPATFPSQVDPYTSTQTWPLQGSPNMIAQIVVFCVLCSREIIWICLLELLFCIYVKQILPGCDSSFSSASATIIPQGDDVKMMCVCIIVDFCLFHVAQHLFKQNLTWKIYFRFFIISQYCLRWGMLLEIFLTERENRPSDVISAMADDDLATKGAF